MPPPTSQKAQYYYYIHQEVDPDKVGEVSGALSATKISTSARAGMMSTAEARRQAAAEKAAEQQRLYAAELARPPFSDAQTWYQLRKILKDNGINISQQAAITWWKSHRQAQ